MSRAVRTKIDGITFASKVEAQRYEELKLLECAGVISDLEPHPKFVLRPKFKNNKGKTIRKWTYTADFQYVENGVLVVEDVKGTKNGKPFIRPAQKPSLYMFQYQNPDIDFRIVGMRWIKTGSERNEKLLVADTVRCHGVACIGIIKDRNFPDLPMTMWR